MNNETMGISCEVAIADAFDVYINPKYRNRANASLIEILTPKIKNFFIENSTPIPIKHIAEGQNPVDFILSDGKTLSVKSNKNKLGKVAPQRIGQPTAATAFKYFIDLNDTYSEINIENLSYSVLCMEFKKLALTKTKEMIKRYYENLFDTDFYIHFYNLVHIAPSSKLEDHCIFLTKRTIPNFSQDKFEFTQTLETWKESATVKYDGISIGEFQVHRNRNCCKFRFNIVNLLKIPI